MSGNERLNVPTQSRASPAPTVFCGVHNTCGWHQSCGSWLASDSGRSGNERLNVPTPSRASPAPTGFCGVHNTCGWHQSCGSWLASDSGRSGNERLNVPTPSRASPLPQVFAVFTTPADGISPVGAGLPAIAECQAMRDGMCRRHRGQARSHRFLRCSQHLRMASVLWELACQR